MLQPTFSGNVLWNGNLVFTLFPATSTRGRQSLETVFISFFFHTHLFLRCKSPLRFNSHYIGICSPSHIVGPYTINNVLEGQSGVSVHKTGSSLAPCFSLLVCLVFLIFKTPLLQACSPGAGLWQYFFLDQRDLGMQKGPRDLPLLK